MRISDWSSDVCSSDLYPPTTPYPGLTPTGEPHEPREIHRPRQGLPPGGSDRRDPDEPSADQPGASPQGAARGSRGQDRKSVVSGKSVSVRVDLGGRRSFKKKIKREQQKMSTVE